MVPQFTVAVEHYNRLIRMIQQGEKLKMTVDLQVEYQDQDNMGYNTIAEIPGSDLKDEIVMLGGHMDSLASWHRPRPIMARVSQLRWKQCASFKPLGLKPRRTIRVASVDRRRGKDYLGPGLRGAHFASLKAAAVSGGGFGGGGGGAIIRR